MECRAPARIVAADLVVGGGPIDDFQAKPPLNAPDRKPDDELDSLQRAIQNWKQGVFGVLFVMANDAPESQLRAWVIIIVHQLQASHHSLDAAAAAATGCLLYHYLSAGDKPRCGCSPSHVHQVLDFPLSLLDKLPWSKSSVMTPVSELLDSMSFSKLVLRTEEMRLVAVVLSLLWMFGLLACAFWVGFSFIRESFKLLWPVTVGYSTGAASRVARSSPLTVAVMACVSAQSVPSAVTARAGTRPCSHSPLQVVINTTVCFGVWVCRGQVLRAVATLSTTVLFIPLISTAVRVFDCDGQWSLTGGDCFVGVHLAFVIITAIVMTSFSFFSFLGACRGIRVWKLPQPGLGVSRQVSVSCNLGRFWGES